jgi:hypothetical protein
MSKHTPGPWKIITSWNDYMVEGPNGEEIIWQDGNYDTPTISLEDACLIAAAPDLLMALNQVMSWIDNWSPEFVYDEEWPADRDKVRAAIAKATGQG